MSGTDENDDRVAVDEARMSFLEHLAELRVRLRNAAIVFLLAVIVSFVFVKKYFEVLVRPARLAWEATLKGRPAVFHFASPTEPFWVYTKLALVGGLLAASPFVLWELWKFIAPGLYRKEKRLALVVTGATAACFVGGTMFGYFVLCEPALRYMFDFAQQFNGFQLEPTIMMEKLVGFLMGMMLGTGVAFELPVVLTVMGWMGLVTARMLWKFDRYALILAAGIGGVLTPGADVLSQLMLAFPLFGLYNISILLVWMIERAKRRTAAELEKGDPENQDSGPQPPASGLVPTGD